MALLPVADALERILATVEPLPPHEVSLDDALGRVLAEDLVAKRTQPPSSVSAMDGYAVRGIDVARAPARLTVIGEIPAGKPFDGEIGVGQAARIFTGGVMPKGGDTVVIQEHTEREGDSVMIQRPAETGRNVRQEGLDFRQGDRLLTRGIRLNDRDLMLAAAMNYAAVPVIRAPRVAILGTGDELVLPGSKPGAGEIVYSNGYALGALVRQEGAEVIDLGIAGDRVEDIVGAIRRAEEAKADVLLTSGGASVGDHDLVQRALKTKGFILSFWRIAMRPGRPMMHATRGAIQVLGVPGNPVSSYVCSFLFLLPLLRKLNGRADLFHRQFPATLGRNLPQNDERADYLRATLTESADGTLVATALQQQDSSMMLNLARAGCLVIREPHAPAAAEGSPCVILKLDL